MEPEEKECRMILVSVSERGKRLPIARIIVIAPQEKARDYAERVLKPYLRNQFDSPAESQYMFIQKDLGGIFWELHPETIFLYTEEVGRIK